MQFLGFILVLTGVLLFAPAMDAAADETPIGLAPDPTMRLSEYAYDYWGMDHGLPQNTVRVMAQDATGYIWIGTFEGLARFDGDTFLRLLPVAPAEIRRGTDDLIIEPDGSLWIGTKTAGLYRVDPDGDITRYTVADGLASDVIVSLYRDPLERLWIGTGQGLCQRIGNRFECLARQVVEPQPITGVLMTHDGSLWIGTEGNGLIHYQDGVARNWPEVNGVPIPRIMDLAVGPDGHLWAATFGSGLVEYDGKKWRVWDESDGLATNLLQNVLVDPLGSVWIGTYGAGIHRLANGELDHLDTGNGLPNSHVQSLLVDREGSLWFGTSGGLNRLRSARFSSLSTPEGLSGSFVRTVAEDAGGDIWVGTDTHGLNRLRAGRVVDSLSTPDLLSDSVRAFGPAADGGMWVGTYRGGVTKVALDGSLQHYRVKDGLASDLVRAVIEDSTGTVWVGTDRNGITRINDSGVTRMSIAEDGRANDIRAITEAPDGSIWFGTYGAGMARYHRGVLVAMDLLADSIVFAIRFDIDGTAWLGTADGLVRYSTDGSLLKIGYAEGLDGAIFQILTDGQDNLWLCTNRGIVRLADYSTLESGGEVRTTYFDNDSGMRSRQCNGATQPSGWRAADGTLWFPTAAGVTSVRPDRMMPDRPPPPITIQGVIADDEVLHLDQTSVYMVPPGTRRVQFDYAALTFISPRKVTYQYRLDDYDDHWINSGNRRTAFYNDLPPGRYTLRVIAANADGAWNRQGASISVVQQPMVYQTLWFRILVVLALLAGTRAYVRWRNRKIRRHSARLEELVDERTQRVAQSNKELGDTLETLKVTQSELVEARKLAALGSLVAGVAHEVNTPVGTSLTIASYLRDSCNTIDELTDSEEVRFQVEKVREGMNMIQSSLERAGHVVASFKRMHVSREKSTRRKFRLCEVLSNARLGLVLQVQTHGHKLIVECPEDLELESYPEDIYELLTLLITNSLEHAFLKPGGTITIRACCRRDRVEIDYRDDGVGISEELCDRLFEPFSTSSRGTHAGLGMSIVHNIVHLLLGGEVQYTGGKGARFLISIPASAPE